MIKNTKRNQFSGKFLKDLINLDFPFIKRRTKHANANNVVKNIKVGQNFYNILDLFSLNSSLKQFLRILFALKYHQKMRTKFLIYIWCSNEYIQELIRLFIEEIGISQYFILCEYFPNIEADLYTLKDVQQFVLVLGNPWTQKPKFMLSERIMSQNVFIVNSLNFINERPHLGFYRIQNDLADYKKLMVILIMIDRVINRGEGNRKKVYL